MNRPKSSGARYDGSADLGDSRYGPPDGGTDSRADDHVCGEMNPRVDPGAAHRCGQRHQRRPHPRQAMACGAGEREPGCRMPGRKRGRRRHRHLPGNRNLGTGPVGALPRVQGLDQEVDGRRGDANRQKASHGSSPSVWSADNRAARRDGDPDTREVRGLRQPPRRLVKPGRRGGGDRSVDRPVSSCDPAAPGGEQSGHRAGTGPEPAAHRARGKLCRDLASAHHRMLAMEHLGPRRPVPAAGAGHA
jgi:hypothetical protein